MRLHPELKDRLDAVDRIVIETQEPGVRIIDKTGPLANPADRDHCIQYMVAIPLIHGRLTAADYEDPVAADQRVDALRSRMEVRENSQFTRDYYDPDKRFIGNAIQVFFKDGSSTARIHVDAPIGHRRRRGEGYPVLVEKFRASLPPVFPEKQCRRIEALFAEPARLDATPVDDFVAHLVRN
jgi:2-methylcitrate dehydratase